MLVPRKGVVLTDDLDNGGALCDTRKPTRRDAPGPIEVGRAMFNLCEPTTKQSNDRGNEFRPGILSHLDGPKILKSTSDNGDMTRYVTADEESLGG